MRQREADGAAACRLPGAALVLAAARRTAAGRNQRNPGVGELRRSESLLILAPAVGSAWTLPTPCVVLRKTKAFTGRAAGLPGEFGYGSPGFLTLRWFTPACPSLRGGCCRCCPKRSALCSSVAGIFRYALQAGFLPPCLKVCSFVRHVNALPPPKFTEGLWFNGRLC